MTEDEAQTKWCPFVRHSSAEDRAAYNRSEGAKNVTWNVCIGSACMAWRWLPLMADDAFKDAVKKAAAEMNDTSNGRHKAAEHVMANRAAYGLPTKPFDGFCGLAGKP